MKLCTVKRSAHPGARSGGGGAQQSVDRYARAWMDTCRMREKDLPVLEHQKTELKHAGADLDKHRPGARQYLHNALRHEPQVVRAMMELEDSSPASSTKGGRRTSGPMCSTLLPLNW